MHHLITAGLLNLVFIALVFSDCHAGQLAGKRPNIILVLTDDQGMGDLSCLGNPILNTPNIDHFYKQSTRLADFHVSPSCAPTRAAIMSGRHEFRVGVTHTILMRERMALDVLTLPQMLQASGYATGIFGKWHLGDDEPYLPHNRGFDESLIHGAGGIGQTVWGDFPPNGKRTYYDSVLLHNNQIVQTKGYCTDLFFDAGMNWIKGQHEANKPFFAYIATNAPHTPNIAPKKYTQRFKEMGWATSKNHAPAGRFGMIENIDDNFGRMMQNLMDWNALDNTLIIFMTDNGMNYVSGKKNGKNAPFFTAGLRGHKGTPYEGGTRVPSFWYWPGVLKEGVDVNGLTSHIDIFKTFADLVSAKLPTQMQELDGRSLLPLLQHPDSEWPDRELFVHVGRWEEKHPQAKNVASAKFVNCAVRTERWRFVNNSELYDINADPGETTDVSDANPEVVARLRKKYDAWWDKTVPLMVNEGLTTERVRKKLPLVERYKQAIESKTLPTWNPSIR
ncbi:Arylsulfatase [Planctomycetes bacterium CA13]|uniref:Arylsulfatase n=1 Tax=Novipirellula herctigrandis TaxID=2527986 RepID=A0A5C5YZP9_9BACT|nr:Arylsulfatase [Planctomycetes bacterium CA13]